MNNLYIKRYESNSKAVRSYSDYKGIRFEFLEPPGLPSKEIGSGRPILEGTYSITRDAKGFRLITKDRQGILIHAGNTAKDTKGCLLIGLDGDKESIKHSKLAIKILKRIFDGEKVIIL